MKGDMGERSAAGLFISKAEEAEAKAAQAADETERATWIDIAQEYRRLAEAAVVQYRAVSPFRV